MTFSLDGAYFSPSQGSTTGPGLAEGSNQSHFSLLSHEDAQRIDIAAQQSHTCRWITHGTYCGMAISAHKFPAHLRDWHGISGNDKLTVCCQWVGCGTLMNKESITLHGRHGDALACKTFLLHLWGGVHSEKYPQHSHQGKTSRRGSTSLESQDRDFSNMIGNMNTSLMTISGHDSCSRWSARDKTPRDSILRCSTLLPSHYIHLRTV